MPEPIQLAQSFAGDYVVNGRTPDGTTYNGTLRFDRKGRFLHAEANLSPLGMRHGLAMPFAGRLVMAFGPKDKVEIGAYECEAHQLRGLWVPPAAASDDLSGCGKEHSQSTGTGVWLISEAVAIDGNAYHGTVTITQRPDDDEDPCPVQIDWKLHDGEYHSFGLQYPDALYTTFSFEPEKPYGIAVYEITADTLDGEWLSSGGGMTVGIEALTRAAT
jgi:hypothetical protein